MCPGVLVECDPSIKAIILKIDQDKHDYIVEDLDDQTLMVKETQLPKLKARLEEVMHLRFRSAFTWIAISETVDRSLQTRSKCQMTLHPIDDWAEEAEKLR